MRAALWPDTSADDHRLEIEAIVTRGHEQAICLLALVEGAHRGFAEVSLRHDYVNGCDTTPVAFLEGIYVAPEARGRGAARALVAAAEAWAGGRNCREFASDVSIENTASAAMHMALGFEETERVVFFVKKLCAD
ncbi:aminoglycoside 6'-N-acetyltransferase [Devosia pacifica]|uniref:aminoglycoside 6'-N-acetyltransferase n=1 Tax=Devosia pacifica TaxID=1335967 RepID=UPI001FCEE452